MGIPLGSKIWLQAVVARPDIVSRLFDVQAEMAIRDMDLLSKVGVKLFGGGDIASSYHAQRKHRSIKAQVVGVSNQITSATPRENIHAMLETISR